ncbi:hypothetical protein [uncultured Roseibium sp.]|uniref:hypothetical protein n=1 Tax=uncultured Roseibium sp. TaxID=1936171 RepID=UPI00321779AD
MKILDLLAKLGILRFGVKSGTYHSGKDRPAEFLVDGVYDAEKRPDTCGRPEEIHGVQRRIRIISGHTRIVPKITSRPSATPRRKSTLVCIRGKFSAVGYEVMTLTLP